MNNRIKTVTVLGANGTMGRNVSAIYASFGECTVYLVCRDLNKAGNTIRESVNSVRAESIAARLIPADYSMLDGCVRKSDLIIEHVREDLDIKKEIIAKAAEAMREDAIVCTGSSGLSVTAIAECLPETLRKRFFGVHMFNPPYVMTLCELIPTKYSDMNLYRELKAYLTDVLHRTVVEAKDSPGFLGNRIGFQFINEVMQLAEKHKSGGGIDYMDAIFGPFTGRALAPLVTADFVGLDVHKAIVDNLYSNTNDFFNDAFCLPEYAKKLVSDGRLGEKNKAGLYRTVLHDSGAKIREVYDIESGIYRNAVKFTFPYAEKMIANLKEGEYGKAFGILKTNESEEAVICCGLLLKYIIYSLYLSPLIGCDIHSADDAMATGFNWCPPLALIDAFGGKNEFASLCRERLAPEVLEKSCFDELMKKVEPSGYDFRKYIRAGR